jgi:hypothetical protein
VTAWQPASPRQLTALNLAGLLPLALKRSGGTTVREASCLGAARGAGEASRGVSGRLPVVGVVHHGRLLPR